MIRGVEQHVAAFAVQKLIVNSHGQISMKDEDEFMEISMDVFNHAPTGLGRYVSQVVQGDWLVRIIRHSLNHSKNSKICQVLANVGIPKVR